MTPDDKRVLDDKYQIIRQIKQGGFGIVYYGMDRKLGKPVAIKEIAPNLLADPKYLDMFQDEALNIAKLSHNNIVHIYELKKAADGHFYIIMEYIDGIDMEKIIRAARKSGSRIPPHLVVFVISEICMALEYAHHRRDAFTNKPLNLVHQDISPSNIMVSRDGVVKLIDFGIASVKRHRNEMKDNKLRGKIPYMAPEQLIMGNHPDHRSDLFSLGLVMFESITGERLFGSQEEVIAAGKNPKWFRKVLKGKKIPTAISKILLKALEIDLTKRYQTANHMYIDLLQYLISTNETGELMDDLALYLADQFPNTAPPITPPSYDYGTGTFSTTDAGYSPSSPVYPEHDQSESESQWEDERLKPAVSPLAARLAPLPGASQPLRPGTHDSRFVTMDIEPEGEEELKTVIDVVRLSARNQKTRLLQVLGALLVGTTAFGVFDTMNGWTKAGTWISDRLFPPAIEIVTVPQGATTSLDGLALEGATPLSVDKITPGVHKLELALPGYEPIIKSLFVPREGSVKIQGNEQKDNSHRYLFRFSTQVRISSQPPGADVYINGLRYNQKTPCKVIWEVGAPLSLELRKPGLESLSGFALNTLEGYDEVEDRRFWNLSVYKDNQIRYAVDAVFTKRVRFDSTPQGAEIVDVSTGQVLGVARRQAEVLLPVGRHVLAFRKDRFETLRLNVDVDESTQRNIQVLLSRKIRIQAVDSNGRDIGASLISLRTRRRETLRGSRRTPLSMTLPAVGYTAVLSRPGYERAQVKIGPGDTQIKVTMRALKSIVQLAVVDAVSEEPVDGADVFYRAENQADERNRLLDQTDFSGGLSAEISGGTYVVTVTKAGYSDQSQKVNARPGETLKLAFRMFPSN